MRHILLTHHHLLRSREAHDSHRKTRRESGFCTVRLKEPSKDLLRKFKKGQSFERILRFDGFDYPGADELDGGFEATVNLSLGEVAIDRITNGHAPIGFHGLRERGEDKRRRIPGG